MNLLCPQFLFLGFIFEQGQYRTDPEKTKVVAEWPTPKDRKQLRHFLGKFDPRTSLVSTRFVPSSLSGKGLHWIYSHQLTCYPGTNRMLAFTKKHVWWPTLYKDVKEFFLLAWWVTTATSLWPVYNNFWPLLSWPWSHIAVNFTTGLPPSNGKTVISEPPCEHFYSSCFLCFWKIKKL